ncbi:hypothetical protein Droror1_Dr00026396 [Drosera rotundifolia]
MGTADGSITTSGEGTIKNVIPLDSYGTGLWNAGENSCFLNVIIQSLWHIKRFRNEFLNLPADNPRHIDDLVLYHLHQILTALSNASMNNKREVVASTPLRSALKDKFQEHEEQDAHEALEEILAGLHRSFTNGKGSPSTESVCNNGACISHSLFGLNFKKIKECGSCGAKFTCETNTWFYLLVIVDSIRTAKESHRENSFSELLHSVDKESLVGGDSCVCVLIWKKIQESIEDISDTFKALTTEIDLGVIYPYLKTNIPYILVSMVCFGTDPPRDPEKPLPSTNHFICFVHELERWIMYSDSYVKIPWSKSLSLTLTGNICPSLNSPPRAKNGHEPVQFRADLSNSPNFRGDPRSPFGARMVDGKNSPTGIGARTGTDLVFGDRGRGYHSPSPNQTNVHPYKNMYIGKYPEKTRSGNKARSGKFPKTLAAADQAGIKDFGKKALTFHRENNRKGAKREMEALVESDAGEDSRDDVNADADVNVNVESQDKKDKARVYWDSLSGEEKKEYLRVSDSWANVKDTRDGNVLREALIFGYVNKTWRFIASCECEDVFADSYALRSHVGEVHFVSPLPKYMSVLPYNTHVKCVEKLFSFSCDLRIPLELEATINRLRKQSKQPFDPNLPYPLCSSSDTGHAKLLTVISCMFKTLLECKCLTASQIERVIQLAMVEL